MTKLLNGIKQSILKPFLSGSSYFGNLKPNDMPAYSKSDFDAISSDWHQVGKDLKFAMRNYNAKNRQTK